MNKAVKFKNNNYLDSTGIVHNKELLSDILDEEDFTSKVTFNESVVVSTRFIKKGNVVYVTLQGENKTHSGDTLIATIPEGYRPVNSLNTIFVKNSNAYGTLQLTDAGLLKVGMISSTTVSGRIYANFTYCLD